MIEQLYKTIDPKKIAYEEYTFQSYAVIEGAKVPMLYSDLEEGILAYDILFREEALREKLQTRGPFFVQLDFESEDAKEESMQLLEQCYGKNAMLLFATPLHFAEALERMREIFYLKDEAGEVEGIIRFYEPDIFRELMYESYKEIHSLFNNIYCYWCEEKKPQTVVEYRYTPKGIGYRKTDLTDKETS